ncbi:hypothetical protein [Hydrocarboniclastica marina]|uniref:PilZ domain-containing protein n=1 Tax=Hydrocarboniclastica marina TaxID=2259620 RepID=A0A4P7XKL1_9ALTE|nr:hypothetical protein [Hydrocarboniclastica marina]MAL97204.1 hypothetical protein [Alteromonadaceae bacterium]QCF27353.1 hypothetical protein soil367_16235 [Hydrocarboniclastica marina]|tara:strand:- start:2603 stop:3046 length:444 start_codon:yes stop_codon:yes gene_type:complete
MGQSEGNTERRHLQRFPALELEAQMKPQKRVLGPWTDIEAFDFTRTGLSIATPQTLAPDDVVMLRLRLPLATGDLTAERLVAVVRNVQPQPDHTFRYGVEFDFGASRHMKRMATSACLGRIEGILDRSEKLRNRLMSQQELLKSLES